MGDSSASRVFSGIHEEISLTFVEPSTRATVFWCFICSQCFLEEEEESCLTTPAQECPATEVCIVQSVDFHGTTRPIARRARNAAQRIAAQRKPCVRQRGEQTSTVPDYYVIPLYMFPSHLFISVHRSLPLECSFPCSHFFFLSAARGGCNLSQCLEVFSGNRLECISCRNVGPRWLVRLKLHNDCLVNPSQNARRYVIVQSFVPKSLKKKSDTAVRQLPGGMVGSKWTFLRFGLALLRCSKLQILLLLVAAQLGVACQLHSVYLEQGSILHLQMYFIQLCHSDSIYKSRHSQVCVLLDLDGFGQWKSSWVTVLDILVTYIYT